MTKKSKAAELLIQTMENANRVRELRFEWTGTARKIALRRGVIKKSRQEPRQRVTYIFDI